MIQKQKTFKYYSILYYKFSNFKEVFLRFQNAFLIVVISNIQFLNLDTRQVNINHKLMKNNYQRILSFIILLQFSFQILSQTPTSEQVVVNPTIIDPTQTKPLINQKQTQPLANNPTQTKHIIHQQKQTQPLLSNPTQTKPLTPQKVEQHLVQTPTQIPSPNPTVQSKQAAQVPTVSSASNTQNNVQHKSLKQGQQQAKETNQPRKRYQYVRQNEDINQKDKQYVQDQGQKQSLKQQINLKQTQKVGDLIRQQHFDSTKNYDFELINGADFYVKSSIEHKYVTVARSYSFIDGDYKVPDRIQDLNPIQIQVYDDKGRKIAGEEFFFIGGVSFDMVPGVNYQISFNNVENQLGKISAKLVTVSWKHFAEHEKLSGKMVSDNKQIFSRAALRMRQQAQTIFGNLHQLWLFDNQAQHSLNTNTMKLFYWSVFQILITIIAAAIQVQIIRRLLRPTSIVI